MKSLFDAFVSRVRCSQKCTKSTNEIEQTLRFLCCLPAKNHLLLDGCASLYDLRRKVARVSSYQVQRLLNKHQRCIAFADGFDIDEEQWSGSLERRFSVQTRYP